MRSLSRGRHPYGWWNLEAGPPHNFPISTFLNLNQQWKKFVRLTAIITFLSNLFLFPRVYKTLVILGLARVFGHFQLSSFSCTAHKSGIFSHDFVRSQQLYSYVFVSSCLGSWKLGWAVLAECSRPSLVVSLAFLRSPFLFIWLIQQALPSWVEVP